MRDCTLDYDQAWKLLVSVRLAAQCTDARVNVVVEDLYEKVSGCGGPGRGAEPEQIEAISQALRAGEKQGKRHQRLYEYVRGTIWRKGAKG